MKNLFNEADKQEILKRIDTLTPQSRAQWGKMNVNQALRHMAMAFHIPSGKFDPTPDKVPGMPKWLLKFFLVNVKPPKGKAETFREMNMVNNNINPSDFEAERRNLKNEVEQFAASGGPMPAENKIAGKFSKDDWGKLNYNHADHHLRQFGA